VLNEIKDVAVDSHSKCQQIQYMYIVLFVDKKKTEYMSIAHESGILYIVLL
jgi:hypothetical protein